MTAPLAPEQVTRRIATLRPVLLCLLQQPFVNRQGFALAIAQDWRGGIHDLGVHVLGDLTQSPYPNARIAVRKRDLSLRCHTAGHLVPADRKTTLDGPWTGSAWHDGLAVGCAGLTEAQDNMVAHWVAHALIGHSGLWEQP